MDAAKKYRNKKLVRVMQKIDILKFKEINFKNGDNPTTMYKQYNLLD